MRVRLRRLLIVAGITLLAAPWVFIGLRACALVGENAARAQPAPTAPPAGAQYVPRVVPTETGSATVYEYPAPQPGGFGGRYGQALSVPAIVPGLAYPQPSGAMGAGAGGGMALSRTQQLQAELAQLEAQAFELAQEYRRRTAPGGGVGEAPSADDVRADLLKTVERAFAVRQRLQQLEVDELRQRLSAVESRLTKRESVKDQIIERRVADLLDEDNDLEWDPTASGGPALRAVPSADRYGVGGIGGGFGPAGGAPANATPLPPGVGPGAPQSVPLDSAAGPRAARGIPADQAIPHAIAANNLKQIGLAMHNFADVHGAFPPAVVMGPDGRPWHSWRVLILPYIEQQALYEQYRWDEPWNGPNNGKLLAQMPALYRAPFADTGPDTSVTRFVAVTGENACFSDKGVPANEQGQFPGQGGRRFAEIIDGTSNTIMVGLAEANSSVPWMKPEDIVVGENFPGIGQHGGFGAPLQRGDVAATLALFCDGSVHVLGADVPLEIQQALLSINGGEVIDTAALAVGSPAPNDATTAAPGASATPPPAEAPPVAEETTEDAPSPNYPVRLAFTPDGRTLLMEYADTVSQLEELQQRDPQLLNENDVNAQERERNLSRLERRAQLLRSQVEAQGRIAALAVEAASLRLEVAKTAWEHARKQAEQGHIGASEVQVKELAFREAELALAQARAVAQLYQDFARIPTEGAEPADGGPPADAPSDPAATPAEGGAAPPGPPADAPSSAPPTLPQP